VIKQAAMKFNRQGLNGAGYSPPFLHPRDYIMLDTARLNYLTVLFPFISPPSNYEQDRSEKLEMRWFYLVGYDDMILLRYDFQQPYFIIDMTTPPTDEQLIEIIKDSYRFLQNSFQDRLNEFIVFKAVPEIEEKVIEQAVAPLRELFPVV
jgi:hypothetical protein